MENYVIRATDKNRSFRVFIAKTTQMAEEARNIHHTTPVATAAVGRLVTAASMMGIMEKSEKMELTVSVKGDGEIGSIMAVTKANGDVKAYVTNPDTSILINEQGKLNVGAIVGNGKLTVIKDHGLKEPYIGQSDLVSGEIAEDLAHYYLHSEQQPSAVSLGVLVDSEGMVKAAGGMIVQVLPNISDDDLDLLEYKMSSMVPMSELIDKGFSPEEILEGVFGEMTMDILETREVRLKCDCCRERMERALLTVGEAELRDMIEKDKGAQLTCHFCNTAYDFNEFELEALIQKI